MNETLCRALTQAALSEVDVAARLEVDPKTVRRWMNGRLPYLRHRLALCALLGVSQADLWPLLHRDGSWPDEVMAIYPHLDSVPERVWLHVLGSARNEVDVLAGVEPLTANGIVMNALRASRLHQGVKVRICVGEQNTPSEAAINMVQADRGTTRASEPAFALVAHLGSLGSPAVRVHEGVLYNTICRSDNELLVVQHAYGIVPQRGPVCLISNLGAAVMFRAYAQAFDQMWATARPVR